MRWSTKWTGYFHGEAEMCVWVNFNGSWTRCWRRIGGNVSWTKHLLENQWCDVKEALDEWDMSEAKEVETPGMTEEYNVQSFLNADLMSKESAAKNRRTAATLNYLALDNPLIAFASEEASRSMSAPRQGEEVKLKRILRFLRKRHTTTRLNEWQDHSGELTGYTDSDWARSKLTRRSTSGGVILHGSHLLLHYSRTQAVVALSSAGAELNAALTMGCEILVISQFCRELGDDMEDKINGDSSAV